MRVEISYDSVEARSKAEIVHLLDAFMDCIHNANSSSINAAFLHGFHDLQLLRFLFLLAFLSLALE